MTQIENPDKPEKKINKKARLMIVGGVLALALLVAIGFPVLNSQLSARPTGTTIVLDNGVIAPRGAENSGHGYLLDDNRIPRVETCEEWSERWLFEGPAVGFTAAQQYPTAKIEVSTQIYIKNQHLDSNGDGVICFHEDYEKPVPAYAWEPWIAAVEAVRAGLSSVEGEPHPIDFAASPNSSPEHARIIREGVEFALRVWSPYINSKDPLPTTLVHPDDKQWFLKRTREIGDRMDQWWDYTDGQSGGAVGATPAGVPTMYFMTSEGFPPSAEDMNYYVHEVAHFFETLNLKGAKNPVSPCWFVEGPATFIGYALAFPEDQKRTIEELSEARKYRGKLIFDYYYGLGDPLAEQLEDDVLNLPLEDKYCQHDGPALGYNLGMFVAEKLIFDYGFSAYIEIVEARNRFNLPQAFEAVTGRDYEDWVSKKLVPHLDIELRKFANG